MNARDLLPVARELLLESQTWGARPMPLARGLARGRPIQWADGATICSEGESSDSLFLVTSGRIRVLRNDVRGVPRELVVLSAPTLVGHMGVVDGSRRSATCEALGAVRGLDLSRQIFRSLMDDTGAEGTAFRRLILNNMMLQLSRANEKIRGLISDLETDTETPKSASQAAAPEPSFEADRLREIAGVLDGWDLKTDLSDDIRFSEDEDMRRTRRAREGE